MTYLESLKGIISKFMPKPTQKEVEIVKPQYIKEYEEERLYKQILNKTTQEKSNDDFKRINEELKKALEQKKDVRGNFKLSKLNESVYQKERHSTIEKHKKAIIDTLNRFNIQAEVINHKETINKIKYQLQLQENTSVSSIKKHKDDLQVAIGKDIAFNYDVGVLEIVVAKNNVNKVALKEMLSSDEFTNSDIKYKIALGVDEHNKPVIADLMDWKSTLIGGKSGSGKSSLIHTILCSLLFNHSQDTLKLVLIDLKHTELTKYNKLPHLLTPVIEDLNKAIQWLKFLNDEMETRNKLLKALDVRDIEEYNQVAEYPKPIIVLVIDEYSLLSRTKKINDYLTPLLSVSRAAGIYTIVATQKPNKETIDPTIKANFMTSIALKTKSWSDSKLIIEETGAEELLGNGDMIIKEDTKDYRLQCSYVYTSDLQAITSDLRTKECNYIELDKSVLDSVSLDDLFNDAKALVKSKGYVSVNMLRQHLQNADGTNVGDPRARRIIEQLKSENVVNEEGKVI